MKITLYVFLLAFLLVSLQSSIIDPSNPPTGRTGAPGETTCQASGCHTGGSFTGTVEITGVPDSVVAEETYSITLIHTSDAAKAGFQLTVLDEANTKAGTLTAGTGCSIGSAGGRQYVRQSSPHNINNGTTSWTFTWKAPATVVDDSIHFYFTALAANGNGQKTGDNVLVGTKNVVLPAFVSGADQAYQTEWVKIFPNPAKDFFTVETTVGTTSLKLTDENGRIVLQKAVSNGQKIDISSLSQGVYVASFADGNGRASAKLVLVR